MLTSTKNLSKFVYYKKIIFTAMAVRIHKILQFNKIMLTKNIYIMEKC